MLQNPTYRQTGSVDAQMRLQALHRDENQADWQSSSEFRESGGRGGAFALAAASHRNGIARGVLVDRVQEGKRIASARKAIRRWIVPLNHQEQRSPTIASVPRLRAARETEQHQTNQ